MMRCLSIALLCLAGLGVGVSRAAAYDAGQTITDQPEVVQALADARAYWNDRTPACPVAVATADVAADVAAEAENCTITVATWWLNTQPAPSRTQWCALFAHEYGHLLGYGHDEYREDFDHVMSLKMTPRYCHTFGVGPTPLPKTCQWPTWARATPAIRRLYAAGKVNEAGRVYRAWRKAHPKVKPPAPCVSV